MISQGDKYKKKNTGLIATVLTKEPEDEYLIKVEIEVSKEVKIEKFLHIEQLKKFWYDLKEGLQMKMF